MSSSLFGRRVALVTALLLLSPVAPRAGGQSVDEIVARNLEAKGGVDRLRATMSVRTSGHATIQGSEVRIRTSSKRPHFILNEMEMGGKTLRQGFDGETLWMAPPDGPAQALPPGPQTEVLKQTSQIDSPLLDYKQRGTTIELAGTESEGERRLHHLVLTPKAGLPMHYYIDAETGLESKIVIEAEEQGRKVRMEMRFSDYRTVDGRAMPFSVQQFVNGNRVGEVRFETVEFNLPLDDSIFRMPKAQ